MKCYQIMRFGEIVGFTIGFEPKEYFMRRENLRVHHHSYEVSFDCGGSNKVIPIFDKNQDGSDNYNSISFIDERNADVSKYTPVIYDKNNDWFKLFRSLEEFNDYYEEGDLGSSIFNI